MKVCEWQSQSDHGSDAVYCVRIGLRFGRNELRPSRFYREAPLNLAELRDGWRWWCTGRPEIGTAFRRLRPPIATGNREPTNR